MICRECESVQHCMANGCIPVTDAAPGTWAWLEQVIDLALIVAFAVVMGLIVVLPLYFGLTP